MPDPERRAATYDDLMQMHVDRLSLDYLVGLCAKAGVVVKVKTAA